MIEKLRQLKEKSHMTNQQIAERSNIPESTVARILSGKTSNPTISTVLAMARAMGDINGEFLLKHLDKDLDEKPSDSPPPDTVNEASVTPESAPSAPDTAAKPPQTSEINLYERLYTEVIQYYKDALTQKDKWTIRLFFLLAGAMLFILFVLVFDILHPNFGYVTY